MWLAPDAVRRLPVDGVDTAPLPHLLVASAGRAVTVHDGLAEDVLQRALDALLPAGPPARRAVLASPGLSRQQNRYSTRRALNVWYTP